MSCIFADKGRAIYWIHFQRYLVTSIFVPHKEISKTQIFLLCIDSLSHQISNTLLNSEQFYYSLGTALQSVEFRGHFTEQQYKARSFKLVQRLYALQYVCPPAIDTKAGPVLSHRTSQGDISSMGLIVYFIFGVQCSVEFRLQGVGLTRLTLTCVVHIYFYLPQQFKILGGQLNSEL